MDIVFYFIRIFSFSKDFQLHMVYIHILVDTWKRTITYICAYIQTYMHMYVCVFYRTFRNIADTSIYLYLYTHIYIHTYICIRMYIHTYRAPQTYICQLQMEQFRHKLNLKRKVSSSLLSRAECLIFFHTNAAVHTIFRIPTTYICGCTINC